MEKKSPLLLRERVDWAMEQFPNKTSTNVPKINLNKLNYAQNKDNNIHKQRSTT